MTEEKAQSNVLRNLLLSICMIICMAGIFSITSQASDASNPTKISTNGTWVSGTIATKSAEDWYKFTISSDGELNVQLMGDFEVGVRLYTEDLTQYKRQDTYGSSSSPKTSSVTYALEKGTYYIKINNVNGLSSNLGDYKVKTKFTSYNTGHTGTSSYNSPISYTVGDTKKGAFTWTVDTSWYKFKISTAGSYKFTFTDNMNMGMHVYIKNSDLTKTMMGGQVGAGTTTTYTATLNKGTYYLNIYQVNFGSPAGPYSFSVKAASVSKPTISSAKNTANGVKLTWKKSSNASGYYVYRKTGSGSYKKIKTIKKKSTVTYTDTSAKNGSTYTYKVVAYSSNNKSSGATKKAVRVTKPSVKSLKSSSSKKATVKWKKNSKATGYQVQYSTSKSFSSKKTVTVKGKSKSSKKLTKLTGGKKYYVRVRTYKTVSGKKYYSAWSSKKSVTVKK